MTNAIAIGVDVAYPDGVANSNWSAAAARGIKFAYLRSDFSTVDDPTAELSQKVRDAGIKVGRYFFPDERASAVPMADQISHFVAREAKLAKRGDLPAAFDVEYSSGVRGTGRTRAQLAPLIVSIATGMRSGLGYSPVLYSSARVLDGDDTDTLDIEHQGVDLSALLECPFWCSRYVNQYHQPPVGDDAEERAWLAARPRPPLPKFLKDALNVWIWQHQGDARGLAGVAQVDVNVFYMLVPGERSERVAWKQRRLGMAERSGVYDAETEAAVRKFQQESGLTADGIVGLDTFALLATRP